MEFKFQEPIRTVIDHEDGCHFVDDGPFASGENDMLDPQIKALLEADANKDYRSVEELSVSKAREQTNR